MIIGSIVALVVLAIVVDSALYYNKVHAGVSVAGISLGGKTEDDAAAALDTYVAETQSSAIMLTSGDKTWPLMPAEAGATIDVAKAVEEAMQVSRKGNFFTDIGKRWKLYFSKVDLPLAGSVNEAQLDAQLGEGGRRDRRAPDRCGPEHGERPDQVGRRPSRHRGRS